MNKKYENYLNCDEHLNESIETLIDVFVNYYGEARREEIERKFRNSIMIAYMTPIEIRNLISKIGKEKTNELFSKAIKDKPFSLSVKDLTGTTSFEYADIQPMNYFYNFYRLYTLGEEGRKVDYLKTGYKELTKYLPELTKEEFKEMATTGSILPKYQTAKSWIRNNLEYYLDFSNAEKKYKEAFKRAEELLHKIDEKITIDNFQDYLENEDIKVLCHIAGEYSSMLEEYNALLGPGTELYEGLQEYEKFKEEINKKYRKKYISENINIIPEKNREVVRKYILGDYRDYSVDNYIESFFPRTIDSTKPLDVFNEESSEILNSEEESSWRKSQIIKGRIKYFKALGFDLGEDYEAYCNDERVTSSWPSKEMLETLDESCRRLKNERNNEIFNREPKIQKIRERISKANLIDKEDSFNAQIYSDSTAGTFINPNIVKTKDGFIPYPILAIRISDSDDIDHNLVHELNHIFELSISEVDLDRKEYLMCCGWDQLREKISDTAQEEVDTLDVSRDRRDYELFNEIINELIAQDIGTKMHEAGIYIFDSKENSKMRHTTSYEESLFLVKDFFDTFKDKIIESRSNGNIKIIWDEVGKENFDALNGLFEIFNEHFSGFNFHNLINDLNAGRETERVRIYNELVEKKNRIYNDMVKYSMQQNKKQEEDQEKKQK